MRVLGIDTSCYTTSVALAEEGRVSQERRLLSVAQGERGLRQSSALFQHVERLPELLEALFARCRASVDAVCVSTRPRDAEGSYMPVFKAGECAARAIAAAQGVPLVEPATSRGTFAPPWWIADAGKRNLWHCTSPAARRKLCSWGKGLKRG